MALTRTAFVTRYTGPSAIGFTVGLLVAITGEFAKALLSLRTQTRNRTAVLRSKLPTRSPTQIGYLVLDVTRSASISAPVASLSNSFAPLGTHAGALDVLATTNIGAVVELINVFLRLLAKSPTPRIVSTSSARGSLSFAARLLPARTDALMYNASKSALNMTMVMQANNLPGAPGNADLKVNAASPGHMPSNGFTGTRTPEQGAGVIVYLAMLPEDGIWDHAQLSEKDGNFAQIPW
ncbi:hypothetical protein FIBSPDRAFT_966857 [Athelia psychrophila]|uniref:NAD(P)-binding protein n=1 Tax=Athelia psychrophila TaxID=1759441 RepID=A0A167WDN9_9AGAM|nr:hypothetical protein FIBSPDRAFT_966857 [Fibularhizoctonia sp. CBS 109695]